MCLWPVLDLVHTYAPQRWTQTQGLRAPGIARSSFGKR